ncbi:Alpha-ketoglutarate-dependent taurine dioxygenase [Aspergillus sp. HF37]|nr:Alpha-ketoglutarate-dependent taurine dioxygenase [Aspergillus sp. HF37]
MAHSALETTTQTAPTTASLRFHVGSGDYKELAAVSYEKEAETKGGLGFNGAKYPHYLPTWNPEQKYPPLEPFEHVEHGRDADTNFPNLLPDGAEVTHLTPSIGTEVRGIQLSNLAADGKDELARFVAEHKVVAIRNQDFADLPLDKALEYGAYFGRHHIHPTSGSPEGFPEIHVVHRAANDTFAEEFLSARTSSVAWHSDVTYEQQPPGTTFLYILDKPSTGGDTLFANAVEAYNRLSPLLQERLHGLKAVHSGVEQTDASVLTREIVGLKKEESDALLKFLYEHIAWGADFHVRVKWEEGTVVVWDNRVTQHSALVDWKDGYRHHLARITPQAEQPFETPFTA